jgi:gluconolactonase
MFARIAWLALLLGVLFDDGLVRAAEGTPESIAGLGPVGPVVKLHGGFKFTEGPAGDRQGDVYFSDIPANRIYKLDSANKLSIFREPSNSANGLMVSAKGEIYGCEMEGRVVAMSPDGKTVRPLAETYQGKRFNAPNDLVIDKTGGVYFTDPQFKAPEPLPQGKTAVYYIAPAGAVTRLIDDLKAPNGVILSPDEKTLYVVPTLQAEMMAYPVTEPGKIGAGRVFCSLQQPANKKGTGGDGLTIDEQGNLYITSGLGLQVFSPEGKALGIIAFPEQPANATFAGPDGKTLYVTARTSLYTVPMSVKGHVFPAGAK